ncbi:Rha family transcriptional regulator [Vibrio coralliilyticus]|uniref:Rha family transcriptional regulator n=1 Tax=Vibrio coralliilyticus TaxID=190893 RepID=UPI0017DE9D74|nr:Rha family transcriptional regulator [Vibrio coralliilyticus]NUW66937.1 Rha family transcriptional regulator [Vibrio coralliilyticus]
MTRHTPTVKELSLIEQTEPDKFIYLNESQTLVTNSFSVAKYFGKQHKNIIRDITSLDCSRAFTELNFELCFKTSHLQNNKRIPYYQMSKNGFMFLVMGFTGKKAALIKEKYILAFDAMEKQLAGIPELKSSSAQALDLPDFHYQRIFLVVENGDITEKRLLNHDEYFFNRQHFINFFKEPGVRFDQLDQLKELSRVVNDRLVKLASYRGRREAAPHS